MVRWACSTERSYWPLFILPRLATLQDRKETLSDLDLPNSEQWIVRSKVPTQQFFINGKHFP